MELLIRLHHNKDYYTIYKKGECVPLIEGHINGRNVREIAKDNGYKIVSMALEESSSYDISKYCLEVK